MNNISLKAFYRPLAVGNPGVEGVDWDYFNPYQDGTQPVFRNLPELQAWTQGVIAPDQSDVTTVFKPTFIHGAIGNVGAQRGALLRLADVHHFEENV